MLSPHGKEVFPQVPSYTLQKFSSTWDIVVQLQAGKL